jgi:hypothetical protein
MFNLEDCNEFYNPEVPKRYRKSWYIFVYKFLICVNGDLLKSLQGSQVKEQKNIFNYVSVSDEAFTRWVLEIRLQKVKFEMQHEDSGKKAFQKPSGPHASLMYSSRYSEIYSQVLEGRKITTNDWNDIFWSYFKIYNKELFQENSTISHDSMARAHQNATPMLDDDRLIQAIVKTNTVNPKFTLDDDEIQGAAAVSV